MRINIKLIIMAVLCMASALSGKIIYVDDDATGANNGSSWENAYLYLQDALANANSYEKPVEIRVAQGIYRPNQTSSISSFSTMNQFEFQLINGVTLEGGYAGITEPYPNTRDINEYETILSGDLAANDIDVNNPIDLVYEPTRSDNCYTVVMGNYTDKTAVLDGFTITGGNDRTPRFEIPPGGGGMYNEYGSPTINNCTFADNSASVCGGGMINVHDSNPILTNCKFIRNYSGGGGGVYNGDSRPTFINCTFMSNYADFGAGMDNSDSNSILINCTFSHNISSGSAGGLGNLDSNPLLAGCRFIGNRATRSGGGIYNNESNPIMENCLMSGNIISDAGGGMYVYSNSNPTLKNCTFVGNWGVRGKSIGCYSNPDKINNIKLINCILWDGDNEISNDDNSIITITYSDMQGGWEGQGNINIDPLFVNPGYWADTNDPNIVVEPSNPNAVWIEGDYHLKSQAGSWYSNSQSWIQDDVTSPCIDAGDPMSPIGLEPFPNGGRINMGSYGGTLEASKSYFGEPLCQTIIAGDINGDCKVDWADLEILLLHWLEDGTKTNP
jgi:parallel beta-helix repeat protein